MADQDLTRLDEWFSRILAGLSPSQRRRAAIKLGHELRRANLRRIAANVEPDGRPMEPRKPRPDGRGRLRRQTGKMFKGLRKIRNWKVDADAEGVAIRPASGSADRVGAVSQFGEVDTVGRSHDGRTIRHRYATRRLAGFSPDDERIIMDVAEAMMNPGT